MESKQQPATLRREEVATVDVSHMDTSSVSHNCVPKGQAIPTSKATNNIQESNRGVAKMRLPGAMTKANSGSPAPTGQAITKEQNNPSQPPPCKASTTTHQAARPRHPKTGPNPPATRLPHTVISL